MKDEVRHLALCLIAGNLFERDIAEKAASEETFFRGGEVTLFDQLLHLLRRTILCKGKDTVLRPPQSEFRIPGQDDTAFLAGQMNQLMKVFALKIEGVVTQHPQCFCQFSQGAIRYKFHFLTDIYR